MSESTEAAPTLPRYQPVLTLLRKKGAKSAREISAELAQTYGTTLAHLKQARLEGKIKMTKTEKKEGRGRPIMFFGVVR